MFADFLPPSVVDIQDSQAIAFLVNLQRRVVQVPFEQGTTAITTAYICYSPDSLLPNASPILLLPGFDSSLLEFRHLLPFLATNLDIWTLDLFGFGFTEYISTIEQTISNSQLIWIPKAGHAPHVDRPQSLAKHLLAFVQQGENLR